MDDARSVAYPYITLRDQALCPALLVAALLLPALGCELVLGDLPSTRKPDAGTGGAGGSTGSTTTAGSTTGTTSAGGGGATTTSTSVSTTSTSSTGGGGGCCDCDGDTHKAKGVCGGDDCDDGDAKAFPDEDAYYGTANPVVGYDWDCNGTPEREPALDKAIDCGLIGLPCAAGTGFLAKVPPPCGGKADWGTCKQSGISCVKDVLEIDKVMTCK